MDLMAPIRWFLILVALAPGAVPAQAADLVYPTGSRIGLAPPPGLTSSNIFFGYEDRDSNVAIVLVPLPPDAYADLEKSITADALKKQGIMLETREPMTLSTGKALLVIGRQEVERIKLRKWILLAATPKVTALVTVQVPDTAKSRYPDASIRTALRSLAVRTVVPVDEQLALLPFKVGELAGFRVAGVIPGRAIMLGDAIEENASTPPAPGRLVEPHIFVTIAPGGPEKAIDRDQFARDVFAGITNLKGARVTGSEGLRIGGQQGHQIFASARDPASGTELSVVQWLRFGGGAYMQFVGIARAEVWTPAYARFRSVRDGVEPR